MRSLYTRDAAGVYHERFGLPFEALEAGQTFVHRPSITIYQHENVAEALSTFNAASIHYDEAYASRTAWGRPLLVSTWTLQRMIGMTWKTFGGFRRRIETLHSVRMATPLFGGDTLRAQTQVLEVHPDRSQRVRLRTEVTNQRGESVAVADYTAAMRRGDESIPDLPYAGAPADEARFASHRASASGWEEMYGLCFEDLKAGETYAHAPRRLVESHEIAAMARNALDWSTPWHDGRGQSPDEREPASVPQTWLVGLATALTTHTFGCVSANLGWTDVRFQNDVHAGALLHARSTVLGLRESRTRPQEGIVQVHTVLLDRHEQVVLDFQRTLLVYKRHALDDLAGPTAPAAA